MRTHLQCFVAASALTVLVASAHAAPVAQWLTPWMPVFDTPESSGGAAAGRCFGIGCTADGQTLSLGAANQALPDTGSFAAAAVSASSPFIVDANASAQVIYSRQFELTGSATGWDVTLSGSYTANGTASGSDVNSLVTLAGTAAVRLQPLITSPTLAGLFLTYTKRLDATVADPSTVAIPVTAFAPKTGHLDNGTYWVYGQVLATTHVDAALLSSGTGNGGIGASFALNAAVAPPPAAPVPEPGAWAMMFAGLSLIGWMVRRRT